MKVLFIAPQPFFIPRGTPIAIANLLRALEGEINGKLLTLPFGEDIKIPLEIERMQKIPLTSMPGPGFSLTKILYDIEILEEATRQAKNFQIIHAVEEANFIALLIKKFKKIPFIYDMDSIISHQLRPPLREIAKSLEKKALKEALLVVAVSPSLAEYARKFNPNVFYLPDTPFWQEFPSIKKQDLGWENKIVVLYTGNFAHYQGIDFLLEAFSMTKNPHLLLVLVGGQMQIKNPRVKVIPPVSPQKVNEYLAAADILVSPRLTGINTPMKIYSYLAAGKPIIASDIESHTQVLSEKDVFLLPLKKEVWAEKIDQLAEDESLRREMGKRARQLFIREYSWERFKERAREIYREAKKLLG